MNEDMWLSILVLCIFMISGLSHAQDDFCLNNLFNSGTVSCGNHWGASCSKCPCNWFGIYGGEIWCKGDCHWVDNKCTEKTGSDFNDVYNYEGHDGGDEEADNGDEWDWTPDSGAPFDDDELFKITAPIHSHPSVDIVMEPTLLAFENPDGNNQSRVVATAIAHNNYQIRDDKRKPHTDKKSAKWRKGVVPYDISNLRSKSKKAYKSVQNDIKALNNILRQCIYFREATRQDTKRVKIQLSNSCEATFGMPQGRDAVLKIKEPKRNTNDHTCFIHEALHNLGLHHEFTRYDRDKYVDIYPNNVIKGLESNFKRRPKNFIDRNTKYNIYSIMSYGPDFLSKDKVDKRTIRAKRSYSRRKVEGEGIVTSHLPAYTDVLKIRKMYGCGIPKLRICNTIKYFTKLTHSAGAVCVRELRDGIERMTFNGALRNCPRIVRGSRLYEPRDYESFIKVREYLEKGGWRGGKSSNGYRRIHGRGEYWVGTRKNLKGRAYHVSDNAPRNFFAFCGKLKRKGKFAWTRWGCKVNDRTKNCISLKITGKGDFKFNYCNCKEKKKVICEIPETMPR